MLDLLVAVVVLVVLQLLVDVVQLECELVDVAGAVCHLATCCIESVDDLIHGVSSVHFEQILVDREHRACVECPDQGLVVVEVLDAELLLWVLVLFHEQSVLNCYVAFEVLQIVRKDNLNDQLDVDPKSEVQRCED